MSDTVYAMSDDELHEYLAVDTAARHARTALRDAALDIPDVIHAVHNPTAPDQTVVDLLEQLMLRLNKVYRELDAALTRPDAQ